MRRPDLRSPRTWLLAGGTYYVLIAACIGIAGGLGSFTFGYGKGASYLSNNPTTCVNCHIMEPYYDTWQNSSHHHVAVCNDCHLSHHPIGKWITKADNGFFHSLAFTLDNFDEPIRIKPRNRRVTQAACVSCHVDTVHQMFPATPQQDMLMCVSCHSDVGHAHR
ncbi:cytochrome c nitrite reductase small subunit [Synoicihabitans lomoniglobus]|uniref:Cytochrome c nitrite reductase small subunit n=1 Tax=Synoicihabitans lomoniglobus TaxID=2909285 RepID=A0AAF0CN60_9BACT|nr:cytochrome c nitrite reductase small subunit [Opitutaceae bacterium LMO-M01]WED64191.1 cytochrome c nitrite reductase small subunit [Opitutaceae bacterium LMO-M01]